MSHRRTIVSAYEAYAEGVRLLQADNFHAAVVALARAR